jgi:membrane associated rhomboid family serine protease/antitoxin component YwqK of YwqJK toxin-antitoxin module
MDIVKRIPVTLSLLAANCIIFLLVYLNIGTFSDPDWILGLLRLGALHNAFTLEGEWYRIVTSMFLHGNILHLLINMYGLYSVGSEVEQFTGSKKFLAVYLICGLGASLASLYIGIFQISVGASGAIFGMFGFSLVINVILNRKLKRSIAPVLLNFFIFLAINIAIAKSVRADNAAHFGGLATGLLIGIFSVVTRVRFSAIRLEYGLAVIFIISFMLLPRYQVLYYQHFQKLLAIEDASRERLSGKHTDPEFVKIFQADSQDWDSVLVMLTPLTDYPEKIQEDIDKLKNYAALRKLENHYRVIMIERESYIYQDSVEYVNAQMATSVKLNYYPNYDLTRALSSAARKEESSYADQPKQIRVLYDSTWIETTVEPAPYYRIGIRDSLNQWQGRVTDFYANGQPQMKGVYLNNKRDGIFIYYSDHATYTSAGRYRNNRFIGKWETFHENGRIASEVFYTPQYFIKSIWDAAGTAQVIEGNGIQTSFHANGAMASQGEYRNGLKSGYWRGNYPDGKIYFEENFYEDRLIKGRSYGKDGEIFIYDASSLFPIPQGGFEKLNDYIRLETRRRATDTHGTAQLSFRVTVTGAITDIVVEKSITPELDEEAKKILLGGPTWMPATEHGQHAVDAFAFVTITF